MSGENGSLQLGKKLSNCRDLCSSKDIILVVNVFILFPGVIALSIDTHVVEAGKLVDMRP